MTGSAVGAGDDATLKANFDQRCFYLKESPRILDSK